MMVTMTEGGFLGMIKERAVGIVGRCRPLSHRMGTTLESARDNVARLSARCTQVCATTQSVTTTSRIGIRGGVMP